MSDGKFFDKSISPKCAYCLYGKPLSGGEEVFCVKKGLVDPFDACRKYKYDPLKRVPKPKDIGRDYNPEDFKL
ncbi:MAG: hypothetical protein J6Q76_01125 [Clostridia bacterium]|nr:hypothetical protein [Clostridia bacterium]